MVVDGADLGVAMTPTDLLIEIRLTAELRDDEIVEALTTGAARVEHDLSHASQSGTPALGLLSVDERLAAIEIARSATLSRVKTWRRRHRQMTWPELRILLLGLRGKL